MSVLKSIRTPTRARMFVALLVTFAIGCSAAEQKKVTGTVAGTVTVDGNPVNAGQLNFLSTKGTGAQAEIDDNGSFSLPKPLEVGEYKVFVTPPLPEPQRPGSTPQTESKFDVPPRFQDATSSGLVITIEAGQNDVPVEFKS